MGFFPRNFAAFVKRMPENMNFYYEKSGGYHVSLTGKKVKIHKRGRPSIVKKIFNVVDVKCLPSLLIFLCENWVLLLFETKHFSLVDSFQFLRSGSFSSLLVFSSFHSNVICVKNLLMDELIMVDIVGRRTKVVAFKENLFQPILALELRGVFINPLTQNMFSMPTVQTATFIVLCLKNYTVEKTGFPAELIEKIMEKTGFFGKKRVKMKHQDEGCLGVTTRPENFTDSLLKF
jgi:hypothetical protein